MKRNTLNLGLVDYQLKRFLNNRYQVDRSQIRSGSGAGKTQQILDDDRGLVYSSADIFDTLPAKFVRNIVFHEELGCRITNRQGISYFVCNTASHDPQCGKLLRLDQLHFQLPVFGEISPYCNDTGGFAAVGTHRRTDPGNWKRRSSPGYQMPFTYLRTDGSSRL